MNDLLYQIGQAANGYKRSVEQQQDYEAERRKTELERRLNRARAAGNQEQIDRYEKLLRNADK